MTDNSAPGLEVREDEWLAVRCQLGERAAFDELVARWHEPLWRYVRRVTAEDGRPGKCCRTSGSA